MQLKRLVRIVELLREERFPNSKRIVAELEKSVTGDLNELDNLRCSEKTAKRDIKLLKEEFHCPLAFDRANNGYYLTDRDWNFFYPAILDETEMLAMFLGLRLAEQIIPDPLKSEIQGAVEYLLSTNNPELRDRSFVRQLSLHSMHAAAIKPEIFMPTFQAWQKHRLLKIVYRDRDRENTERIVEPHALVYYENTWYIKTFCHLRNLVRTFMLHRIEAAEMLSETFKPNPEIYEAARPGNFLQFKKIPNIKIRFHRSIHDSLYAKPLHKDQIIDFDETSEYLMLHLPECFEEVVLPWVLSQMGKAEIEEPKTLRDQLLKKLTYMVNKLNNYKGN